MGVNWSNLRVLVKITAQEQGKTLKSIAQGIGVSRFKFNEILDSGPSEKQMRLIAEQLQMLPEDLEDILKMMVDIQEEEEKEKVASDAR